MQHIKYILLIVTLLILVKCTERIQVDLKDTTPRLVVDGAITTDTTIHYIRLTESGSYFINQPLPAVSNAQVLLSDGIKTISLLESDKFPGYYITPHNYHGIPGRTYSIAISDVDIDRDGQTELYEAESYLNPVSPIDSIRLEYHDIWELWKILLYAHEPGETEDYYLFRVFMNNTIHTDQLSEVSVTDDRFFNGSYANGVWVQSIDISDEKVELNPGDTVSLQMSGITRDYFEYVVALQEETGMKVPLFSGPPANLPGNVSNGALGFFRAYSSSMASVIHAE
jgi:hypothetical protein